MSRRSKKLWSTDIEKVTTKNRLWRKVLYTGKHLQVVIMSVPPGQELGWERHGAKSRSKIAGPPTDQFFRVDSVPQAHGVLQIGHRKGYVDEEVELSDGVAVVVPEDTWHNVINTSSRHRLTFYTIYAPPHHPRDRVDRTKSDELSRERREGRERRERRERRNRRSGKTRRSRK